MPVNFTEKPTEKNYFLLISIILVLVILGMGGYLLFKKPVLPAERIEFRKIEIDFASLESPEIKVLHSFEKLLAFDEEIGRENPFIPYSAGSGSD